MSELRSALAAPQAPAPGLAFDPAALTIPAQPQLNAPAWFNPIETKIRRAEGTSQGSGMVYYGGAPIQNPGHDFPDWPGAAGPTGEHTSAAGPGQWERDTWNLEKKIAARKGVDLDFSNPDHHRWAMFDLASRTYRDHTGRSLEEDQKNGTVNLAALSDQWEGLGSRNPAAVHRELQTNMFGAFNPDARQFSAAMIESVQQANARYDTAMRRAEDLQDFAMASERKVFAQAMSPPRNNHEAWNQWGWAASLFALVGGLGRRHFTAALGAAGAMMNAAEEADRGAYDRSYQQWKDQRDFGMRGIELFIREANEAVANAGRQYDHQIAALNTLSTAYQLPRTLDHQTLADMEQRLVIEQHTAALTKAQNTETEKRLAVDELDHEWARQNDGQPVPASVHNANVGRAEQQRSGTHGTPALLTDPTTGQQYTMTLGEPSSARTLTGEPYTPGGAARVGAAGAGGAAISDQDAEYWGNVLKSGGHLPPGFARSMGAASVQKIMARVPGLSGGDPGAFIANSATVKADAASLTSLTKMTDAATSFEKTASRNFDLALKLSKDAIPTDWGPWLNRWIETGETQAGNTNVPPYVTAMLTGANEYAKIMSGSTGAQGATVDSRREAAELFSPYLSKGQIERVVAVAKADMENRKQSLYGQLSDITARIHGGGFEPSAPGGGSPGGASGEPRPPIARPEAGGQPTMRYDADGNRIP